MNTNSIEEIIPTVLSAIEAAIEPKFGPQYDEALMEGLKYLSACTKVYAEFHSVLMRNEALLEDFEKYCVIMQYTHNCTWAELSDIQKEQVRRVWAYAVDGCWADVPDEAYYKAPFGEKGKAMIVGPAELWDLYQEWRNSEYPGASQRDGAKPLCLYTLVDFVRECLMDMPGVLAEDAPAITKYALRVRSAHALSNNNNK